MLWLLSISIYFCMFVPRVASFGSLLSDFSKHSVSFTYLHKAFPIFRPYLYFYFILRFFSFLLFRKFKVTWTLLSRTWMLLTYLILIVIFWTWFPLIIFTATQASSSLWISCSEIFVGCENPVDKKKKGEGWDWVVRIKNKTWQ